VRSPTKANSAYTPYAVDAWPDWPVDPGDLTPHGQQLMTLLGSYYSQYFTGQGLLTGSEQQDAQRIYFYADNRVFCKLVAAARKEKFGAEPSRVVAV
jgi:4-phytase/acid phosphatase